MINPPAQLTIQQQLDKDVAEWEALKVWMATAKARESELRHSIAERMFNSMKTPNGFFPEGTSNITKEGDAQLYRGKLTAKLNREILEELLVPTLTEAALTPEEAKGLIKGQPKLGLTAYRKLPDDKRAIVDKMIVVKPGAIELEITPLPK